LEGYYLAFEEAGLAPRTELVVEADFNSQSGYDAMKKLLNRNPELTAAFVASDNVAVGAIHAVQESGRKIPDDFSIVGFDDIPMSAHLGPGLTTIHVPAREIASQSCHLLMRIMQGEAPESRSITLSAELIVRNSTAVLRGDAYQSNVVSMLANQNNV
jgi:LacI family transcriptional regulator